MSLNGAGPAVLKHDSRKPAGARNAKRRVDETRHVQRSTAIRSWRGDIHGPGVNALVGSFPLLK
jgi:hypothetical protein